MKEPIGPKWNQEKRSQHIYKLQITLAMTILYNIILTVPPYSVDMPTPASLLVWDMPCVQNHKNIGFKMSTSYRNMSHNGHDSLRYANTKSLPLLS